jgi:hypothetical protein
MHRRPARCSGERDNQAVSEQQPGVACAVLCSGSSLLPWSGVARASASTAPQAAISTTSTTLGPAGRRVDDLRVGSGAEVRRRAARRRRGGDQSPVIADRDSVHGGGDGPECDVVEDVTAIPRCADSSARDRPRHNGCRSRPCSPAPAPGGVPCRCSGPVAGHGSSTGRPAAMSSASSRSLAGARRTPRGARLLRSVARIWVAGRPRWVRARVRSTAAA